MMKPYYIFLYLFLINGFFPLLGQTGTSSEPFSSLVQASSVASAGIYYFDINCHTFHTYIDANGYVLIAKDYGNGTGNLPQSSSLDNVSRGILSPTTLAILSDIKEVRISSSTGNFDVKTTNSIVISRVQSNSTLHKGLDDNGINNHWTGIGDSWILSDATCNTDISVYGDELNSNIVHICGNGGGMHWIPSGGYQREHWYSGEIQAGASFNLWVRDMTTIEVPHYTIGITNYTKLQDAINASVANDIIEVIEDETIICDITVPQGITLSIPSTFTVTFDDIVMTNNGTTMNNGTINLINNTTFLNNNLYEGTGTCSGDFTNNGTLSPGN